MVLTQMEFMTISELLWGSDSTRLIHLLIPLMFIGVAIEESRSMSDSTQINPTQNIRRTTSEGLTSLFY